MKLDNPVSKLPLVGPVYARRLQKLDITAIEDLIHHIPHRYADYRNVTDIEKIKEGDTATVRGEIASIKNIYTRNRKQIQRAIVQDKTGKLDVIWFNQRFIVQSIKVGDKVSLSGKIEKFNGKKTLVSPDYENINTKSETIHTGRLVPIYPETYGISSKWLRGRIKVAIGAVDIWLDEFLPRNLLQKQNFVDFRSAINSVHFPESPEDARKAKLRLSFNELLFLQLKNLYRKADWQKNKPTYKLEIKPSIAKKFIESLSFEPTVSQKRSIRQVYDDLNKGYPMNRLLEGDVGSGKTLVAAAAAFSSFVNGFQSVFMAPTQILARQHFFTLENIFKKFNIRVSLITSAETKKSPGKTDIFVGTHALIHRKVDFDRVALVVIDEQHRFGVEQRAHLVEKSGKSSKAPHVLTVTATPIPRSIALTFYGDLDLSTLDELPQGRKPITTWIVPSKKRSAAYGWISDQIKKEKIQVFIVCPLIEESEKETMKQVKAATQQFEDLKKVFGDFKLGLLHGKLKVKEKNKVIDQFKAGKIDILVTTPVVEVGIDVPNATIMIIEAADRFGLAQLHQLRGRIGRGEKKSYCLLFSESYSKNVLTRLNALKRGLSGFELAELDLKLRGPGEIYGTKQHGFPELKIASWQDVELNQLAKKVAQEAIDNKSKFTKLIKKLERSDIIFN